MVEDGAGGVRCIPAASAMGYGPAEGGPAFAQSYGSAGGVYLPPGAVPPCQANKD